MARRLRFVVMVVGALALTGCVSMPSSGLVGQYSVTQGSGGSDEQYLQVNVEPPGAGWKPVQIVAGFLAANASFANNLQVAREYLTGDDATRWQDGWSATVFSGSGPSVRMDSETKSTAQVTVSGTVEATVGQSGAYIVPQAEHSSQPIKIDLVKENDQWRISNAPPSLLLSEVDFAADYQSRDLYFFNPSGTSLIADPVYVPIEAARSASDALLTDLVTDLLQQPTDWLGNGATTTAFPAHAKVASVSLAGGTATVNLGGHFTASQGDLQHMAAQLLWTLGGSNDQPVVNGVQLEINGKPWAPGNSGISVLQQSSFSRYAPPQGSQSSTFYYLDSQGDVMRQAGPNGTATKAYTANTKHPVRFTSIAVSPDQRYLAAIAGGEVYTGTVGGPLVERFQGSFTSVSWDSKDQLWMAEGQSGVEMASGTSGSATSVIMEDGGLPVTALQVAPDGVRVALVLGKSQLTFGAISLTSGGILISQSPFSVTSADITALTWYGAGNVIALSGIGTGSVATEYPVNGGASTTIQSYAGMANITASWSYPLISNPASGDMSYNESINGAWISLGVTGNSATYPG